MRSILVITLCLVFVGNRLSAQRYTVQLLGKEGGLPVSYATVGISGRSSPVHSDSGGFFTLDAHGLSAEATVVISMIGYRQYQSTVSGLASQQREGQTTIFLEKKEYALEEVAVISSKTRHARLGNVVDCLEGDKARVPLPYIIKPEKNVSDTLMEIGTLMKVKKRRTVIDSIAINVGSCTYGRIFYRLNIYQRAGGTFTDILTTPVYIDLRGDEVGSRIVVSLAGRNIVVKDDFIVSLEKVRDLGPGEFTICGRLMGAPMYFRLASRPEDFVKIPLIGMGMAAYVRFSGEP